MVRKQTKKKAAGGPAVLDLDTLKIPEMRVRIGGVEHVYVTSDVDNVSFAGELETKVKKAYEAGDGKAVKEALTAFIRFLVPSLSAEAVGKLDDAQIGGLVQAWTTHSTDVGQEERAEEEAVAANPTSPG